MTEFESILQSVMYHDRASIYRLVPGEAADGSDDYEDEETLVAEDVPCKLSQYGKELLTSKTERALSVKIDLRLCCARDVGIREGDRVIVSHQERTFELFAGTRFVYPTHAEVSVRRSGEAGNDGH